MAVEVNRTGGVKIIIGPHEGACGLSGVTIVGSEEINGIEKVVLERDCLEKDKRRCVKINGGNGGKVGCPICTADPNSATDISKFCPFYK